MELFIRLFLLTEFYQSNHNKMALLQIQGGGKMEYFVRKESVTYSVGDLVYNLQSDPGYTIPADATAGNLIGIANFAIDNTKENFATTNEKIPVLIPSEDAVFEADVSGTLATTHVGEYWDLTAAGTVNVAASAKRVVLCVGFISASKGLFKINASAYNVDVTTS